ncbi:MAG: exodeoxyribonuclease VII large subunit, partial [Actinobacteria bacterium]|nr:exodeoxyribonuclease VII large subunit [Actinomycetota bacterium]
HVYLDRTDGEALVKCVIWKSNADRITELPHEGQLIQARYSKIRVYAKNGSVSLDVNAIRGAGEGELLARVHEALARLVADGLTDPERKLPLPRFPRRVGLVTGRGSDAEADVIRALRDRFAPTRIAVSYSLVQGVNAVPELIDALARLDMEPDVDVIIMARGGGSVEDLLPFSDERLCRAIAALGTPVVTSIGHTKQRPNCDHVASAAAEVPAAAELVERIDRRIAELTGIAWGLLATAEAQIDRSAMRPAGQAALIARLGRIDLAGQSLSHALIIAATTPRERITRSATTMLQALQAVPRAASLDAVRERLGRATGALRHQLALGATSLTGALNLVRARDWRERGFALVRLATGDLVPSTDGLAAGQHVTIQLKGGTLAATIEHVHPDETETKQ